MQYHRHYPYPLGSYELQVASCISTTQIFWVSHSTLNTALMMVGRRAILTTTMMTSLLALLKGLLFTAFVCLPWLPWLPCWLRLLMSVSFVYLLLFVVVLDWVGLCFQFLLEVVLVTNLSFFAIEFIITWLRNDYYVVMTIMLLC